MPCRDISMHIVGAYMQCKNNLIKCDVNNNYIQLTGSKLAQNVILFDSKIQT
jgi:hypothetical protein